MAEQLVSVEQVDRIAAGRLLTGEKVGGGDGNTYVLRQPSVKQVEEAFTRHRLDAIAAIGKERDGLAHENQAIWRCAIGDAVGLLDVLRNRWVGSRRKAEREAGATLSGVLDLLWAARDPAARSYNEAAANGKAMIDRARAAIAPIEEDQTDA